MGQGQCGGQPNDSRSPGSALVLSVVRTAAWGMGDEEDIWQVAVMGTDKVRDVKAKVADLYAVLAEAQRLSLTAPADAEEISDDAEVEQFANKKIYLNPSIPAEMVGDGADLPILIPGEDEGVQAAMAESLLGEMEDAAQANQAIMESLQGVTYNVNFERPQDAGGEAAGKKVQLILEALAQVEIVQQMVEAEMFGGLDKEPAFLVYEGQYVMPHLTLHHYGIEEGSTVQVLKERPETEQDQILAMLAAGGDADAGPSGAAGSAHARE